MRKLVPILFLIASLLPQAIFAQELIQDKVTTVKAKVETIEKQEVRTIPGTEVEATYQILKVKILEGDEENKVVTFENDYIELEEGETFYLRHTIRGDDGRDLYSVSEPYRLGVVYFFIGLFVVLVFIFGGIQGVRGLASLIGSLILILYVLLPGILQGYSPILVSVGVSSLIIIVGSYITHGFNKTTTSAVIGMIATVVLTGLMAYAAVYLGRFTGFASDEAVYLNFDTQGTIDFAGLLLGGIMIGLLGVLYDVAIGQAISVEELHRVAPHLERKVIYKRALRIGREHIGALVNTLAIAYVGVSLPLLLLFYKSGTDSIPLMLNREIFATEIIRTMVGSIGLVLAVPITTLLAVLILMRKTEAPQSIDQIEKEKQALEHFNHH